MPIDFSKSLNQLPNLIGRLNLAINKKQEKLRNAKLALRKLEVADTNSRAASGKVTWLSSGLRDHPLKTFKSLPLEGNHIVMAVDGSHVDVDRHSSAFYYLINIGYSYISYGDQPYAQLWNDPFLYVNDTDLSLDDRSSIRSIQIEGPLLGIKRAMMEVAELAKLVVSDSTKLPIIALLDGSLIFWSLSGHSYPDFVREEFLDRQLITSLDQIKAASDTREIALASYISKPRSRELVNSLRLSICPYNPIDCESHCSDLGVGTRPCDEVDGLFDIDLMQEILKVYERSVVFLSTSNVMDQYQQHQICYFYLNTGSEIGRVEMPIWVAEDDRMLNLLHSCLLNQLSKGQGYPLALQEAHEQAVINVGDRMYLTQLVEELMVKEGLPVDTSEKARSKRTRFV